MDIEDAFVQDAIESAGVDVSGEEEDRLRVVIHGIAVQIADSAPDDVDIVRTWENLAVHAFEAGRAYQADQAIVVGMSPATASLFMEYLIQRST